MSSASFIRARRRGGLGASLFLAGALAGLAPLAAQTPPDLASRTELRPFSSLSLSDGQFLQGDGKATPVTIAGELRFPASAAPGARLPAVVVVHGSGGASATTENWARIFNRMGIASFVIDSFSGRGLTAVSTFCPSAFSFTRAMKSRTTGKATSASSRAMRTSRNMSATLLSVMRAWPLMCLTRRESLSVRVEAIGEPQVGLGDWVKQNAKLAA